MRRHVAGIDVGGARKGFHVAVLDVDHGEYVWLDQLYGDQAVVDALRPFAPDVIAIDAPPRAHRPGPGVRPAELACVRLGYRVQYTRAVGAEAQEWMVLGEGLWGALRLAMPQTRVVETFPTAASDRLTDCPVAIPLRLLHGRLRRKTVADHVDACICAWVARKVLAGAAEQIGPDDPLGQMYV